MIRQHASIAMPAHSSGIVNALERDGPGLEDSTGRGKGAASTGGLKPSTSSSTRTSGSALPSTSVEGSASTCANGVASISSSDALTPRFIGRGGRRAALFDLRSTFSLVPELPAVFGAGSELFIDADQLVVLRGAVGPRGGPGFDLAAVGGDCDVGDRRVLRLAR